MSDIHPALSSFSEDELAFKEAIRGFAESEIKPLVEQMDREAAMDKELVKKLFEMGLMGIESKEQYGGAEGSFTMACIAIEELGRVDASVSVLVDVQNTLVTNAFLRWGSEEQKK